MNRAPDGASFRLTGSRFPFFPPPDAFLRVLPEPPFFCPAPPERWRADAPCRADPLPPEDACDREPHGSPPPRFAEESGGASRSSGRVPVKLRRKIVFVIVVLHEYLPFRMVKGTRTFTDSPDDFPMNCNR